MTRSALWCVRHTLGAIARPLQDRQFTDNLQNAYVCERVHRSSQHVLGPRPLPHAPAALAQGPSVGSDSGGGGDTDPLAPDSSTANVHMPAPQERFNSGQIRTLKDAAHFLKTL